MNSTDDSRRGRYDPLAQDPSFEPMYRSLPGHQPSDPEPGRAWTWKTAVFGALVLAIAYLVASPWIALHQIRSAVAERNADALSSYIDFPALRQSLKDQFNAYMAKKVASDNTSVLSAAIGSVMVERLLDSMLTSAGIRAVMSGQGPLGDDHDAPGESKPLQSVSARYTGMNTFVIETPTNDGKEKVRWVMRRSDLSWKLVEMQLPLDDLDAL